MTHDKRGRLKVFAPNFAQRIQTSTQRLWELVGGLFVTRRLQCCKTIFITFQSEIAGVLNMLNVILLMMAIHTELAFSAPLSLDFPRRIVSPCQP